jgi:hypothetical protein
MAAPYQSRASRKTLSSSKLLAFTKCHTPVVLSRDVSSEEVVSTKPTQPAFITRWVIL